MISKNFKLFSVLFGLIFLNSGFADDDQYLGYENQIKLLKKLDTCEVDGITFIDIQTGLVPIPSGFKLSLIYPESINSSWIEYTLSPVSFQTFNVINIAKRKNYDMSRLLIESKNDTDSVYASDPKFSENYGLHIIKRKLNKGGFVRSALYNDTYVVDFTGESYALFDAVIEAYGVMQKKKCNINSFRLVD